ncbi:POK9 protein, partial [Erpornis zantholeuca]|nr:POK9 protein [Erpornis zantholeuca]
GSLGVDVATAIEVTLQDKKVTLIPTTAFGPLYSTDSLVGGLLLGRSSTCKQGVVMIPGVIDADFTGQIKVMAYALQPPVTIPKGSRIAHIVALEIALPHWTHPREKDEKQRGIEGFGSSGFDGFWTLNMNTRPQRQVILQRGGSQIQIRPMMDTGADVTIIN